MHRKLALGLLIFCVIPAAPAFADVFTPAVHPNDVDLEATAAFGRGEKVPLGWGALDELFSADGDAQWQAGSLPEGSREPIIFHYRLAFKQPAAVGMGFVRMVGHDSHNVKIRALRADAPFPGDPETDEHWESLPYEGADGWYSFLCSPEFQTRALLATETRTWWRSRMHRWQLFSSRLHDITPYAIAQGEQAFGATDPMNVTRGGAWQNAAPDDEKKIYRRPVTSIDPSWFILSWDQVQRPAALRLHSNFGRIRLYAFIGDARVNPAVASSKYWKRVLFAERWQESAQQGWRNRVLAFEPTETRAIKILVEESEPPGQQIVGIKGLAVWTDLGDNPVPPPPARAAEPPPVRIHYTLDEDAEVAFVIDDAQGKRLRNLEAQVERSAGPHFEAWDLRDDFGLPMPPGTYRWKAIYAPPVELVYEMTPYPNVEMHSPDSRPWNYEPKDGWLSNHGNQCSVAAVGDRVYMGAGGTEGGHAFIEVSLDGQKQWGSHSSAGQLITDRKMLFIRNGTHFARFDSEKREFVNLFNYGGNPDRRGQLVGAAARAGKIYLAFTGLVPYLSNATHTGKVDIENCLPKLRPSIERSDNYGIPVTPQRDFMSLFRLGGHICGDPRSLLYLETTEGFGRSQHIVLSFKEPVPLGSLLFPAPEKSDLQFRISLLKPNAPYPPRAKAEGDWTEIDAGTLLPWDCLPVPEGALTRAVRITFSKPGDALDAFLATEEPDLDAVPDAGADLTQDATMGDLIGQKRQTWKSRLEGMRLLRSRFRNLMADARISVSSGKYDPKTGEWHGEQTEVLSREHPGVFMMEWDKPQTVRGLAVKEIDGQLTEVDVYTGPDGPIDLAGTDNWVKAGEYRQETRNYYQPSAGNNSHARYLDGLVDFGQDYRTRAVRLRIVSQWSRARGVRIDRGARQIELNRCRVYGVAPLQHIGGEVPFDHLVARRIAVYDGATGKLEGERVSGINGPIAFNYDGELFAIRGKAVAKVDEQTLEQTDFITDMIRPYLMDFDPQGRLYVYDHDRSQRIVRVYDPTGKYLHTIGAPAPKKAGPWDPTNLDELCALSVDGVGNIWMVYPHENPRRFMQFRTDGTFVREYLGNTHYGGGGVLDPYDKSRVYWKDVMFKLDWKTGKHAVKSLLSMNYWEASPWSGTAFRNTLVPIVIGGVKYLVTCPLSHGDWQNVGAVYIYNEKTMTMRMAAAMGMAASFPFLDTPEYAASLGGKPLQEFRFLWIDRNGDGTVQQQEVTFSPMLKAHGLGRFDHELGIMFGSLRYEVGEFLADGTPVYVERQLPFETECTLNRLLNGNYFRFGSLGDMSVNEVITPQGERVWHYPAWTGVSGLWIPPWQPGVVTNQFGWSGHAVHDGALGEFFVIHANTGQMNIWTSDGLLAGHVTYHLNDPRARRFPSEHKRGTRLDPLTLGQEHFSHYFTKTHDGKYYIVAGGNHISVVEVKGLEKFRRLGGEIVVTPELYKATQEWQTQQARRQVFARAPVVECTEVFGRQNIQSMTNEQTGVPVCASIPGLAELRMAYTDRHLLLCWKIRNAGPFKNSGDDFRRIFKTGGAVDLQIGTDPDADPARRRPAAGDLRLVISMVNGKPTAVLYRPVAPGAPKEHAWETYTQAGGTTAFDQVVKLTNVAVEVVGAHTVFAAVPLTTLGLTITDDLLLKMDWGVLSTDGGSVTTARRYWANKMAVGVMDEPTEAKLTPDLWGHVRFKSAANRLTPGADFPPVNKATDIEDIFEELPPADWK
ncbi:MAG TPA: hypothetical protein VM186_07570 [Planctomycetota bacterium]|nr:hypothetical protein [Planctomycetota bacterium]